MKRLHISHNDLDGVGCGVLIKKFLPGKTDTCYLSYNEIDHVLEEETDKYTDIIITDISPSYSSVAKLISEKNIVIIDHHISSEKLKEFPNVYHDIGSCATLLTYNYLKSNGYDVDKYHEFALVINDIDIWLLKRPDSLQMGVLFNMLGISRFEKRFLDNPYSGFNQTEMIIIELEAERRDQYIQKSMKNVAYYKDDIGRKIGIVFAESYASELGNQIIIEQAVDYVVLINGQSKKVSLRSAKDIDISVIAQQYGGGGHKNAAGFPLKIKDIDINSILNMLKIG